MSISAARLRELYEWSRPYEASAVPALRHWSFTALSSSLIAGGYLVVFTMLVSSGKAGFDLTVLLGGALALGALHFSVFVVWVHEAAHNALVTDSPRWNRYIGRIVCAPFGVDFDSEWRVGHFLHHRSPVRPGDPQNCEAWTGRRLIGELLWLLIPGAASAAIVRTSSTAAVFNCPAAKSGPVARYPKWVTAAAACGVGVYSLATDNALLPAALVLSFSVSTGINLVKVALEHGGATGSEPDVRLRSRSSRFPLDFILLPFHIGLHFEHHLNCRVPWYELGRYHRFLEKRLSAAERTQVFNTGVTEAWKQLRGAQQP